METLYRKNSKGRYEPVGMSGTPDLHSGIWLVQVNGGHTSKTNLVWRLGDVKPFGDVVDDASLVAIENDLTQYLSKIQDENSEEFKSVKDKLYGMEKRPPIIANVSLSDMSMLIVDFLRKMIKKNPST